MQEFLSSSFTVRLVHLLNVEMMSAGGTWGCPLW
jgi:hypothetical protein